MFNANFSSIFYYIVAWTHLYIDLEAYQTIRNKTNFNQND